MAFVIADSLAEDPEAEDTATLTRALSFYRANPAMRLVVVRVRVMARATCSVKIRVRVRVSSTCQL